MNKDIRFTCTACGQPLEVDPSLGGRKAQCPSCNSTISIPRQEPDKIPTYLAAIAESKPVQSKSSNTTPSRRNASHAWVLGGSGVLLLTAMMVVIYFQVTKITHLESEEQSTARKPELTSGMTDKKSAGSDLEAECASDAKECLRLCSAEKSSLDYLKSVNRDRFAIWKKAADCGVPAGMYLLASCYLFGLGVDENLTTAAKWYRKAAEQGYAPAQFNLGFCIATGNGVPKDTTEAIAWYRKAAEQGYAPAQFNLGFCIATGDGVPKDTTEAIAWYRKAADQGYASAQNNIGQLYDCGVGVMEDKAEAFKWFSKAADQGDGTGLSNLGSCYEQGTGCNQDLVEAYKLYLLAGVAGFEKSSKKRDGIRYRLKPEEIEAATARAKKWQSEQSMDSLRSRAENGDAKAQNELGDAYFRGNGVAQNKMEAVGWYRKAAEQNFFNAQVALWNCYLLGDGVQPDKVESAKWLRKAAEHGDAATQAMLGLYLLNGWGMSKNEAEAVLWFRKAAKQGNKEARDQLDKLGQ